MNFDQAAYGQDDPADTPSDAVGPTLSMVEVARYWNRRSAGPVRLGLDAEVAEAREAQRLAAVLELVGEVSSPLAPYEVLLLGTGSEWIGSALTRLGFRVEASSADPVLVSSPALFDVVLGADALLPLDDPTWLAAVVNLASLVRVGGRILVAGSTGESDRGDGVLYRAAAKYRAVLEPRGFRAGGARPLPGTSENGTGALLAWTRES